MQINIGGLSALSDPICCPLCAQIETPGAQTLKNTDTNEHRPHRRIHLSILGIQFSPLVSPLPFQMDD